MNSPSPRSTDTENELRSLYDALDERDRYITSLENEIDRNSSRNFEINACKNELMQNKDRISELQIHMTQLRKANDKLLEEKQQLEDLLDREASANNKRKSTQQVRLQQREMHMLEIENQRLRASVLELEANEDVFVCEIDTLVAEKSKLSAEIDGLSSEKEEFSTILLALKQDNSNLQTSLDASNESLAELQEKQKIAARQVIELEIELQHVRSTDYHTELLDVKKDLQILRATHDLCADDKNNAERDLDHVIQALNQAKSEEKEKIAAALRDERAIIESLKQREGDLEGKIKLFEQELERAEEKNKRYEKEHRLEDAVRFQSKLEADLRRREHDIKELKQNYSAQKERTSMLAKACNILKEKAGLDPNFSFDDNEINNALKCEENALKAENTELLRQLQSLESERNNLLSQLRMQAAEIGLKGVKFLGMEPAQVAKVVEFAQNLRKGNVELPLNNRSIELQNQLSSIKAERDVDKVTIARLERELFALSGERNCDGETKILINALNELKTEMIGIKGDITFAVSPTMRSRVKEILGEDLVLMPPAAEVQFMCLLKEYDKISEKRVNKDQSLELNYAHILERPSDTPNKELFRQLLLSGQENRELKNKLLTTTALLEEERCKIIPEETKIQQVNELQLEITQVLIVLENNFATIMKYRNSLGNAATLTSKMNALMNLLAMKNKVIHNLTLAKKADQQPEVDTSTSTNELDTSIRRESESRIATTDSSLENAAKLLFEKDEIINNLGLKLVEMEKTQASLLKEAEQLKVDIKTLVSKLEEAEGISCEIEVYKSSCIELRNAVDDGKKAVTALKEKLRKLSKTSKEKQNKINELKESLMKTKGALTAQRQERSRSDHNLKTSTEKISDLKIQVSKLEIQAVEARDEKLKANKKIRRLSSMLQSKNKLNIDEEAVKSVGELQQRIAVQDKTISSMASQSSKLRSELARAKKAIKDHKKEEECIRCMDLEKKLKVVDQLLLKEKKELDQTHSKLEKFKKKASTLQQQVSKLQEEISNAADNQNVENDCCLQAEISSLREKNESLLLAMKENKFDTLNQLKAENFQLRKENDRLLKVDHLGLFEEIESLKYKYNEAVMQINQISLR